MKQTSEIQIIDYDDNGHSNIFRNTDDIYKYL